MIQDNLSDNHTEKTLEPIDEKIIQDDHERLIRDPEVMTYLQEERGLNRETIEKFRLGLSVRNGARWLVIPYLSNGRAVNVKYRSLPPAQKAFLRANGHPSSLFNENALNGADEAFICEGEIDTMTLAQNGFPNAVGVACGANTFLPEWVARLANVKRIYLCYDPDDQGQRGAQKAARLLGAERCRNVLLPDGQDVNDFFLKKGPEDFRFLVEQAKQFEGEEVQEERAVPIRPQRLNDRLARIMDCEFMRHCEKDKETLLEPEWLAMISILAREAGGPQLVHELSKGHPKYSSKETEKKIAHALKAGPHTCKRIKEELYQCGKDCGVKSPAALAYTRGEERLVVPVEFPMKVLEGLAGDFARLYSSYLEPPPHFFFMAFMTLLGHLLSGKVTIDSEIAPQPRLYTLLLGESANPRKSTAIKKTVEFFREALGEEVKFVQGIGSAEGLQQSLKGTSGLLLWFDEFKLFIGKCQIDGSVLLPCVNTLFEANEYENVTKTSHLLVRGVHLSLLAASTIDTFSSIWSSQFTNIGFDNRLFLVPGDGERKHSVPPPIPEAEKALLKARLQAILGSVKGRVGFSQSGKNLFDRWYENYEESEFAKRIDTYALRLMILLAVSQGLSEITEEVVEKTIALCNWQVLMRKLHKPIDSDNKYAQMEIKVRRVLDARGELTLRDVKRFTNYHRVGTYVLEAALENLIRIGEINFKNGKYSLNKAA